jgi:pimeloyl-ACP methyl ester carboxylesterase
MPKDCRAKINVAPGRAKIILPTVFVACDRDMVMDMRRDGYEALETNAPNLLKKYLLLDAGHWIQQERPKEINQLLIDFLEDL